MSVYGYVHMNAGTLSIQKRALHALEWKLQEFVKHLMWLWEWYPQLL